MGVLTATLTKAYSSSAHFMALFAMMFFMMAFVAHWQLGFIAVFATFGAAVASQSRMLFGEYIFAENANVICGVMLAMYWFYAFTYDKCLVMWAEVAEKKDDYKNSTSSLESN